MFASEKFIWSMSDLAHWRFGAREMRSIFLRDRQRAIKALSCMPISTLDRLLSNAANGDTLSLSISLSLWANQLSNMTSMGRLIDSFDRPSLHSVSTVRMCFKKQSIEILNYWKLLASLFFVQFFQMLEIRKIVRSVVIMMIGERESKLRAVY